MKNKKQVSIIFLSLASLVLVLGSCRKEKIKPEQANSFIKYYGKGGTQKAGNVALTPDGGYILVGTTDSYGNGKDILVVKTDQYGNEQWSKVLGGAGDDEGNWIKVAKDGNYVLTGAVIETGGTKKNFYVAKLNNSGSIIWEKNYGLKGKNDYGARIINTIDGGYAAVGTQQDSLVYLVKLKESGDTAWTAHYGKDKYNVGTAVQEIADSNYVTSAFYSLDNEYDILITTGSIQKTNSYNRISDINKNTINTNIKDAMDLLLDESANKIILGNTITNSLYIANITSNQYYPISTGHQSISSSFIKTSDGGFMIAGSQFVNDNWNILVIRTDANANPIWTKTYGGTGNDYGTSVVQTSDGGFVISGTIAFGGNATGANDVMSLIRIDSNGELK